MSNKLRRVELLFEVELVYIVHY